MKWPVLSTVTVRAPFHSELIHGLHYLFGGLFICIRRALQGGSMGLVEHLCVNDNGSSIGMAILPYMHIYIS